MFKKDKQPSFSFSNKKFMLGCFDDKYSSNHEDNLSATYSQNCTSKISARDVSNGDPIATPSSLAISFLNNRCPYVNLTTSEFKSLKYLSKNKNCFI